MDRGTVLRIEKISPNDGHGLRTVVFFKGCPLHCAWCSTPESQRMQPELFYKQAKCLHCARCIKGCPQHALSVSADRTSVIRDASQCIGCFHCAEICPAHAIGVYGEEMTVEQVMREIRKERMFYFFSGGGVTLSGGDVLQQADFARAILKECKEECIHTMAEMDMFGFYENVRKVVEYLDGYYVDIKCMDTDIHRRWTGVDNKSILQNIRRASCDFPDKPMHVRVPLIPGVNDSAANLQATADFCKTLPSCVELELLPFHRLGSATYQYLGRNYAFAGTERMHPEQAEQTARKVLNDEYPFVVTVSGKRISNNMKEG